MRPLIFVGPSLYRAGVQGGQAFDIAPPARCGDVMRAVVEGRKVIGLIDGIFESGPAVWHKEILFALDAGCHLLGAASMGALRAAECWQFGMIGIGHVFEDYLTGRRSADADVAMVHGPAEIGYLPLSVPLVDVADVLQRMLAAGVLDTSLARAITAVAGKTHFKSRTWKHVLDGAGMQREFQEAALRWIAASGPAVKTRDALLLIDRLGETSSGNLAAGPFLHTPFSARLLDLVRN